jgi:hypothetical protein
MKKKTKTTQESQSSSNTSMTGTSTSTPNAPSWVSDLAGTFAGQIPGIKTQVAGPSALQQKAMDGVSGTNFGGMFGDAAALAADGSQPIVAKSGLSAVDDWLNPFLGGVVDATAADLDVADAATRTQQNLDVARQKAFGGSGASLTRAFTEDALSRARASSLGGLRMGAYDQAAGNSQRDADRDLQAQIASRSGAMSGASTLAGIGSTGLGLQADLGQTQRDITQQQANSPIADLMTQLSLFGDLSPIMQLLTGQTNTTSGTTSGTASGTASGTSTTSDPMGQLSQLLQAMGSLTQGAATAAGGA